VIAIKIVKIGTTMSKITHQFDIFSSWWVYFKTNKSQNADMNEMQIYCIFAHRIFSGIRIDENSKPENNAHPPTDNVTNVKNIIPGVFHQRELINAIAIAKVAVSSEINTSDVNCQVNAMSSVY
jgi:hypothetical protein